MGEHNVKGKIITFTKKKLPAKVLLSVITVDKREAKLTAKITQLQSDTSRDQKEYIAKMGRDGNTDNI